MVKDAGVRMLEENLVQGTWGNISIRLDEKHALVTPSGLDYVVMTPDDLPVVDIETLEWTGPRKPTSERKIHAAILRARPEINVVLHSHPTWGATFASTHLSLPAFNDKMKSIFWATSVVQSTDLREPKTYENTVAAMEGRNACFLANHGVFVCGKLWKTLSKRAAHWKKAAKLISSKRPSKRQKPTNTRPNFRWIFSKRLIRNNLTQQKAAEFPRLFRCLFVGFVGLLSPADFLKSFSSAASSSFDLVDFR